ncbi:MAG TPA: L-histidine N(alpha)-methyltransferase [Bryobacteraceae bacterium]|nr:L-histidine N(alpha)-methyltransferase [Bryobacteraceae bacterium]
MQPSVSSTIERREALEQFAADVRAGLNRPGQKELHSKYLYDSLGSALFDAITHLPEYGLTRADERILRGHSAEMAQAVGSSVTVAELGSGSGLKTRPLLEAFSLLNPEITYYPIDVSGSALARCARELDIVARVIPIPATYLEGIERITVHRPAGSRMFVLFLGSTIGNFERPCARTFLSDLRGLLVKGDALLLGADLVKPESQLLAAYDDPTGVTAAFNLNLLGRINRELGGDFNLRRFQHEARYNAAEHRVEMHLRSTGDQVVSIPHAGCTIRFRDGETIWTESSHKFTPDELGEMARATGFTVQNTWFDADWPFAETLWFAA